MGIYDPDRLKKTDEDIIEIVREFSERLGRAGPRIREVVWKDSPGVAPDWPMFALHEKLTLRSDLRGKLTSDEWRPLLAGSTVFEARFRGRERLLRIYALFSLALSIALTALFFLFLLDFPARFLFPASGPVPAGTARGFSYLTIFFFFGVFLLLMAPTPPYFRRLRLRADRIACDEFGTRQDLLPILKKIDGLPMTQGGRITTMLSLTPTISRRIRNLDQTQAINQAREFCMLSGSRKFLPIVHFAAGPPNSTM